MDYGLAGEEVGCNGRRRKGSDEGFLDGRTVEDALAHVLDLGTDDDARELATVSEGVAADVGNVFGDDDFLKSGVGEGRTFNLGDFLRQGDVHQIHHTIECTRTDGVGHTAVVVVVGGTATGHSGSREVDGRQVAVGEELAQVFHVGTVERTVDDRLDGLVWQRIGKRTGTGKGDGEGAFAFTAGRMERTVGINGIDGEVSTQAIGHTEGGRVRTENHVLLGVEQNEAHAAAAMHGVDGIGLRIGVAGGFGATGEVGRELTQITALAHLVGVAALLAGSGQEVGGGDVVDTVLHEENLAVLHGIF